MMRSGRCRSRGAVGSLSGGRGRRGVARGTWLRASGDPRPVTMLMSAGPGWDDARRGLEPRRRPAPQPRSPCPSRQTASSRWSSSSAAAACGSRRKAMVTTPPLGRTGRHRPDQDPRHARGRDRPGRRGRPRRGRGVVWQEVADTAAVRGLAALAGSSPDVGVPATPSAADELAGPRLPADAWSPLARVL